MCHAGPGESCPRLFGHCKAEFACVLQGSKDVDSSGMGGADPEKAVQGNREHPKKPQRTPFLRELAVLFWRTLVEIIRNPALLTMHAGMSTIMGLLCGGIFFQLKWDIAGAQGRLGELPVPSCVVCWCIVSKTGTHVRVDARFSP
jgi:hypothetical protein